MDPEERRKELYGPNRTLARDTAKRLLERDHVQQNFRSSVERQSSKLAFQTETAQSFRRHDPAQMLSALRDSSSWSPSTQNSTHIKLGSDASPVKSIVQSDFTAKPTPRYQQFIPEGVHDIHLADMVPKYMADKSFGKSLYNADFDGEKSYTLWSSQAASEGRKVGRRHKTTAYQKSTHFELGSDPPELVSETSGCFTSKQSAFTSPSQPPTTQTSETSRSTSNVFRSGDYNLPSHTPKSHFLSIQQQDYKYREPPAAGVSTATKKGYSHVLPRGPPGQALSALRQLLVEQHSQQFTNPRDPTSINVRRAFLKYDKDRSGFVTQDSLREVCREIGIPISEEELLELMRECDQDGDGRISYVEFTKFLTSQTEPQPSSDRLATGDVKVHSQRQQEAEPGDQAGNQAYMGAQYQDSTHFHLGNFQEKPTSIYTGDFNPESVRGVRRVRAVSPLSSKVMHEFPVVSPDATVSTSRKDFVHHDVSRLEGERLAALNTNRSCHQQLAVVLSCTKEGEKDREKYTTSVMGSSYMAPPPGAQPSQPVNPVPKDYHHLESNRALPHPPKGPPSSEAKDQYVAPVKSKEESVERTREAMDERSSRIKDNKQTHLVLGFDQTPPLSEKTAQFGSKEAVSPGLPAAGKPNGPTQGYSVLSHECAMEGEGYQLPEGGDSATAVQELLQQRNFLRNLNPRDPLNINLRKAFLEYDKNLSGSISADEVRAVCKANQVQLDEKELEVLMAKCDKNQDGQIDYHEFALYLSRKHPPSSSVMGLAPTTTTRHDFTDPKTKRLTAMQQLVLEQDAKRFVPLQPTHFFHLDPTEDHLLSTTRKDFKPPAEVTH